MSSESTNGQLRSNSSPAAALGRNSTTAPHNIELIIEELVLHGVATRDRYRIADAMRIELAHLVERDGIPPSLTEGYEADSIAAQPIQYSPDSRSESIGAELARSVYGGLRG